MDRKIRLNLVFNLITQLITVLAPLIISPYISRVFNVVLIGDYNYYYSIISLFGLFANMGISIYGIPKIAKYKDNKDEVSKFFYEMMTIRTIVTTFVLFLFILTDVFIINAGFKVFFLLFGIHIISTYLDISWVFQGLEKFKVICIRTVIVKLSLILFVFLFIKDQDQMLLYILINMLAILIPNLLLFFPLKKIVYFKRYHLNLKIHFKYIFELFLPGLAYTLYSMIDRTMIKFITGGTSEVGYYEQAYKIAFVGVTIISIFGPVFSSRISGLSDELEIKKLNKTSIFILLIISLPLFIGIFFLSGYFLPLFYGPGYEKSITILQLFSLLPFIMGISNFVSYQYFIPRLITKPSMIIIILSILLNIGLNIPLIKYYGGFGAAFATIISEAFISVTYLILYNKYHKITDIIKQTYKHFISLAIIFSTMYLINLYYPCNSFWQFILYGIYIVGGYLSCLIIMREQIAIDFIKKIRNKILKRG